MLKTEVPFSNDTINGTLKMYYDNKGIQAEFPYTNGKINGIAYEYDIDGKQIASYTYKNGVKHGLAKAFDKNGVTLVEMTYSDGKINGILKEYFKNGNIHSEIPYVNNQKQGVAKVYTENGQLAKEISFKNDTSTSRSSIGKPNLLDIGLESSPVCCSFVALITGIYSLKGITNGQAPLTVLVEKDITTIEGRLLQVVDKFLLIERQLVKTFNLIAEHFEVGKTLNSVVKLRILFLVCTGSASHE